MFTAQSYLRYQGEKFVKRFDANCYMRITEMLDSHDISLRRGEFHHVLASIQQPTCIIGASGGSDAVCGGRSTCVLNGAVPA